MKVSEEHEYFHALEDAFIRLRGAPLLLSPSDWRTAQRWREMGIPADFVIDCLEEVFARRREREAAERVSSLRYCARAVESAWRRSRDLAVPAERSDPEPVDVPSRLRCLVEAVPREWGHRDEVVSAVLGVTGSISEVEESLARIDAWMLSLAADGLDEEERAVIAGRIEARLEPLRARFGDEELRAAAEGLRKRELRRCRALPVLSLFAPEAEPAARR